MKEAGCQFLQLIGSRSFLKCVTDEILGKQPGRVPPPHFPSQREQRAHYRLPVTTWKRPLTHLGATLLGNEVNCHGLNGHNTTTSKQGWHSKELLAFLSPLETL